mmetsp:Transcript_28610/g.82204  ORF Transcript_28610/g.82204 Transcript_28610/m.82204 type:complete len:653 (-) Transcript_28610:54-2012(-)
MQALRQFFEDGNVQNLADAGRDLAQQLLGQAGAGSVGPGHRRAVISGNHRFHFSLQFERRSDFEGLCQTGVLVASASAAPPPPGGGGGSGPSSGSASLPIVCRWKRRVGEHLIEIPGITDTMYCTSADDIGMHVVCQAEVAGDPSMGRAFGHIGSFEVDPITRMNLENLISSGATSFPARHCRENDPHPRDLQIRVTQDFVKVVHPGIERGNNEVMAPYSADYPRVIIHPKDTCKFKLELSEDPEKSYRFQALSRNSRDLIALLIRCFHSRKYVGTSYILSQLFQNPATPGAPLISVVPTDFDVRALNRRLGKELDRTTGQLEVVEKVLRNSTAEKTELQAQLRETIGSYTEAIEKLHTQIASARGGPSAAFQVQLHEARSTHSRLQLELGEIREKLEEEQRRAPKANDADGPSSAEVEGLRQDVQQLHTRISGMAGDQKDQSKRDITRAEELRRLRADVDMLSSEKEELDLNCMRADKEKAELIENFMYVKGCLDRMQMACIEGPAASPEYERKVAQLKASYNQMLEERNRLAVKVDALDRDREKQKHQREATVERVMNANARLLEERDRLEKEKTRVSELYQRTMDALGAVTQGGSADGGGGSGGGGGAEEDRAKLASMRSELAQKRELLGKREQEGESLRSRLRRLAMV